MKNEEWTGGPKLLQVVVVMNGERSEEERELQKSGLGFLKRSLEQPTLWMNGVKF